MKANSEQQEKEQSSKKVYSRPQLQVYGDLRKITASVGTAGNPDGGNPNNKRATH